MEANANNMPIEMGLIYPQMRKLLAQRYHHGVLLIDPPPPLVDEWCRRQWCSYVDTTVVLTRSEDEMHCLHLYKHLASTLRKNSKKPLDFCTPEELADLKKEYTAVFYFGNEESPALPAPCLQCLQQVQRPVDVYALCAPPHLTTLQTLTKYIETTQIVSIDLLPRGIPNTIGDPFKLFIHYKLSNREPVRTLHLSNYSLANDSTGGYMLTQSWDSNVTVPLPFSFDITPRALFHHQVAEQSRKSDQIRSEPQCYPFTQELSIWYAQYADSSALSGYRYSADFRLSPTKRQRSRNATVPGKKIKQVTRTNSTCTTETVTHWLEYDYAFAVRAQVVAAVAERYAHQITSLKLFCYLTPDLDDRLEPQELEVLWQLLRTPIGALPLNGTPTQFSEAIGTSFSELNDLSLSYYWRVLSAVVELGVDKGLLEENPLAETAVEYQKRRRNLIAEVRGAVVRRAFSTGELKDMLCEVARRQAEGQFVYNAVLLRIATGLAPAIISALQWNDIQWSNGMYTIRISYDLLQRAAIHTPAIAKKRLRFIPCTPFLIQGLSPAYQRLTDAPLSGSIKGAAKGRPVVFEMRDDDTCTPLLPKQIHRMCKEIISSANIDPEYLPLNEDGETKQIDVNALYGDIFRSNLGHYLRETSMDADDVAYSLGNTPPSTYGRSYYDPHDERSLYNLYKCLLDWDQVMEQALPKLPRKICEYKVKNATFKMGKSGYALLTVPRKHTDVSITTSNNHGIRTTVQKLTVGEDPINKEAMS